MATEVMCEYFARMRVTTKEDSLLARFWRWLQPALAGEYRLQYATGVYRGAYINHQGQLLQVRQTYWEQRLDGTSVFTFTAAPVDDEDV